MEHKIDSGVGIVAILAADLGKPLAERFRSYEVRYDGVVTNPDRGEKALLEHFNLLPDDVFHAMTGLKDRADLGEEHGFSEELGRDDDGNLLVWNNNYHCEEDDTSWPDPHSCQCDDECPGCGTSISPETSEWLGPKEPILMAIWERLEDRGWVPAPVAAR